MECLLKRRKFGANLLNRGQCFGMLAQIVLDKSESKLGPQFCQFEFNIGWRYRIGSRLPGTGFRLVDSIECSLETVASFGKSSDATDG